MTKIFISYRREDSIDATVRLYDRLGTHFGRDEVFMDVDTIPIGVDFRQYLEDAIGRCDVLLVVIGERWLKSTVPGSGDRRLDDPRDFVRIEIESALKRGIPVIPVLVGRVAMPGEQELPAELRPLAFQNAAEVRPDRDFHAHVDRLIRGIEFLLQQGTGGQTSGIPLKGEPLQSLPSASPPVPPQPSDESPAPPRRRKGWVVLVGWLCLLIFALLAVILFWQLTNYGVAIDYSDFMTMIDDDLKQEPSTRILKKVNLVGAERIMGELEKPDALPDERKVLKEKFGHNTIFITECPPRQEESLVARLAELRERTGLEVNHDAKVFA